MSKFMAVNRGPLVSVVKAAPKRQIFTQVVRRGGDDPNKPWMEKAPFLIKETSMVLRPSNWLRYEATDTLSFWLMFCSLPVLALVLYVNLMIGDATLAVTPEGYEPEEYEYERRPISRFLARYYFKSEIKNYEKHLHEIYAGGKRFDYDSMIGLVRSKMLESEEYEGYGIPSSHAHHVRGALNYAEQRRQVYGAHLMHHPPPSPKE